MWCTPVLTSAFTSSKSQPCTTYIRLAVTALISLPDVAFLTPTTLRLFYRTYSGRGSHSLLEFHLIGKYDFC
jgi:hypothetical protein